MPPAMVGLNPIIADAQQPHPAPQLLRPRATPIAELVGPKLCEQGPAADSLDKAQEAFIEQGAFQCGFCTPGFILMTKQLLDRHPDPDDDAIKHWLSGNLCRCAAYPEIIEAVKLAAKQPA